jgi:PHP family Zn ribbon phosphoesterase
MYRLCMAKLINVYIHDDNTTFLNNVDNKSKLINDLLREYFVKIDPKQMSFKQLRRLKEENALKKKFNKEWEELQAKLEELDNK